MALKTKTAINLKSSKYCNRRSCQCKSNSIGNSQDRIENCPEKMAERLKTKIFLMDRPVPVDFSEDGDQNVLRASHSQNATEEDPSDWREKVHSVQERNLIALKNSILSDITLEVGPENAPFQAHKLILALGSPVFEAMFYGPLAEKEEKITIPDIMPDGFKVLLRYLYGDITVLNNEIEALNAWIAADKYCVLKLKTECDNFFCKCPMSSSNIWKLLENSIFLNLTPLVNRCKQYLERHTGSSIRDEDFLEIKTETVKEFLSLSSANVTELVLLKSVIHWGKHKVNSGLSISLAEILRPLLPLIRFGALTPLEFCEFLDESNDLLEKSDALAILKHLTQPQSYALPDWCCNINWQRLCNPPTSFAGSSRKADKAKYLGSVLRSKEQRILRKQHSSLILHRRKRT